MEKWADYGISKVRYNDDHSHIEKVKVHRDNGDSIGSPEEWSRSSVVSAIGNGNTFVTILESSDNKWTRGQDVHIVTINGIRYIRTDQNRKASDNLENLPEF
jgi:hypothetical protein